MFDNEFSMARVDGGLHTLGGILDTESRRLHVVHELPPALVGEFERLGSARRDTGRILKMDLHHVQELDVTPITKEFRADALHNDVRDAAAALNTLLGLDRQIMGEPDDPQHRTDPDQPVVHRSLLERLLRRLFP
jgi:hypothetical protein